MNKRILALLLTAAMVFALAACDNSDTAPTTDPLATDADNVANDPKVTLVYAEMNPADTIVGRTAMEFKRLVEEKSGGSITIDVQDCGVLGSEDDVLKAIIDGDDSVDMCRISALALTGYGAKKSMLLSLPYTFVSRDHWWNFANSDLAQEFLNEPQELGLPLRGIFYGEEGFRHFFSTKPINGVDDLKGMKVRVPSDPVMSSMVEDLGGSLVEVEFAELYSALSAGACDVAEQPVANYESNAFPEVANNLTLDGHTLGAIQCVITDTAWEKLTPAQQAVLLDAGKEVQKFNQDLSQNAETEVLEQLKAEGCNVVDVTDKTPWQDACAQVISENISDQVELYQQLLDFAK